MIASSAGVSAQKVSGGKRRSRSPTAISAGQSNRAIVRPGSRCKGPRQEGCGGAGRPCRPALDLGIGDLRRIAPPAAATQPGDKQGQHVTRAEAPGLEALDEVNQTVGAHRGFEFGKRAKGQSETVLLATDPQTDLPPPGICHQSAAKLSAPADAMDIS